MQTTHGPSPGPTAPALLGIGSGLSARVSVLRVWNPTHTQWMCIMWPPCKVKTNTHNKVYVFSGGVPQKQTLRWVCGDKWFIKEVALGETRKEVEGAEWKKRRSQTRMWFQVWPQPSHWRALEHMWQIRVVASGGGVLHQSVNGLWELRFSEWAQGHQ